MPIPAHELAWQMLSEGAIGGKTLLFLDAEYCYQTALFVSGMVQWRIIVFSDSLMTMMMATIIASEDVCMPVGVGVWEVRVCVCMCVWVYCSLASAVFLPRRASTYFNERSNRVISILIYTHISICINHWLCKGSAFPFSKELIDLIKYEDEKS